MSNFRGKGHSVGTGNSGDQAVASWSEKTKNGVISASARRQSGFVSIGKRTVHAEHRRNFKPDIANSLEAVLNVQAFCFQCGGIGHMTA